MNYIYEFEKANLKNIKQPHDFTKYSKPFSWIRIDKLHTGHFIIFRSQGFRTFLVWGPECFIKSLLEKQKFILEKNSLFFFQNGVFFAGF